MDLSIGPGAYGVAPPTHRVDLEDGMKMAGITLAVYAFFGGLVLMLIQIG